MKFLSDLFPVLLFFAAYSFSHDIFLATKIAIAATALQVAWSWIRHRKVDKMLWLSFALITVFGGATLISKNHHFIMWKPTILYWIMGAGLLIGRHVGKNGIRALLEKQIQLPDTIWDRLCQAWAVFFLLLGGVNLLVAYSVDEPMWVKFKLFGTTGLLLAFAIGQSLLVSKYIKED
ncbi:MULTISPECIES: septation protein A [unclassified Paludibacterium]|uniref:septation protein A n=1 Tax=unclassified Paludibacterium TaxID=2618429 RepID=UPI001C04F442|nr:septation protein A [Paludibacterium sp. B53371]BEV71293.1 septation protein A [Paludibacterium sp. THUN1379]